MAIVVPGRSEPSDYQKILQRKQLHNINDGHCRLFSSGNKAGIVVGIEIPIPATSTVLRHPTA